MKTIHLKTATDALRRLAGAALVLVLAASLFPCLAPQAYAAGDSLSSKTWEEVKPQIEKHMGTPYVWAGRSTSGWDCSGFVSYVLHDIYGTAWPGGSWGMAGTDAIAEYCKSYQVKSGSSASDYNNAFSNGTIKPGDIIVFYNASGATVHAAIAGDDYNVYHAWYEGFGTGKCRFDYMWGIDGGHGKSYASFKVYRGLTEGGYVEVTKTSADVKVTGGNASYSLEGAVFGLYQGEELITKFTTDKSGHAKTADKVKNGTYTVKEISAPKGFALNADSLSVTVAGEDTNLSVADTPITIKLTVAKFDEGTGKAIAQGDGSLDGAEYEASYTYDGKTKSVRSTTKDAQVVFEGIPLGDIVVRETKAPAGYVADKKEHKLSVGADMATGDSATFEYKPADEFAEKVARGGIVVGKGDAQRYTHDDGAFFNYAQGDADFAGAEFAIINRSAASVWVDTNKDGKYAASEDFAPGAEIMRIKSAYSEEYDAFVASTGQNALPYGTYDIVETKAPAGYLATGTVALSAQIREDGQMVELTRDKGVLNDVILGSVRVEKRDAELDKSAALGGANHANLADEGYLGASLEGIEFTITNASAHGVMVDGAYFAPGKIITTIQTAWDAKLGAYVAQTPERYLPFGTYTVKETKTNDSYLLTDGKARSFKVRQDGQVVTVDTSGEALVWRDQVVRHDMHLQKKGIKHGEKLGCVPFLITNVTTGEAHVAVTDENGMLNTSSGWYKHTSNTNANDALAALAEIKSADVDQGAGIWFGLAEDGSVSDANDDLGALPFGFYTIEELRCEANEGYELWSDSFAVRRDASVTAFDIDLGTVDDVPSPRIGTTATDKATGTHEAVSGSVTLIDEVAYANLTPDAEYSVVGTLMDKQTGKPVQHEDEDVSAATTFKPIAAYGFVKLEFTFDASALEGHDIVAFESLLHDGKEVAVHADINDEGQTVRIVPPPEEPPSEQPPAEEPPAPEIGTTATDADDGDQEALADEEVTIVDEVAYKNLEAGKEYTLTGTLMDKQTGKPVQNKGKDVTSTVAFKPEAPSGSVKVVFAFDGSALAGHDVVAFESFTREGQEVAAHADIEDKDQTVRLVEPFKEEPKTPAPESPTTPAPTTPSKGVLPKTGDSFPLAVLACFAGAAACIALIAALARRCKSATEGDADDTYWQDLYSEE